MITILTKCCILPFWVTKDQWARLYGQEIFISGSFLDHHSIGHANYIFKKNSSTNFSKFCSLPFGIWEDHWARSHVSENSLIDSSWDHYRSRPQIYSSKIRKCLKSTYCHRCTQWNFQLSLIFFSFYILLLKR